MSSHKRVYKIIGVSVLVVITILIILSTSQQIVLTHTEDIEFNKGIGNYKDLHVVGGYELNNKSLSVGKLEQIGKFMGKNITKFYNPYESENYFYGLLYNPHLNTNKKVIVTSLKAKFSSKEIKYSYFMNGTKKVYSKAILFMVVYFKNAHGVRIIAKETKNGILLKTDFPQLSEVILKNNSDIQLSISKSDKNYLLHIGKISLVINNATNIEGLWMKVGTILNIKTTYLVYSTTFDEYVKPYELYIAVSLVVFFIFIYLYLVKEGKITGIKLNLYQFIVIIVASLLIGVGVAQYYGTHNIVKIDAKKLMQQAKSYEGVFVNGYGFVGYLNLGNNLFRNLGDIHVIKVYGIGEGINIFMVAHTKNTAFVINGYPNEGLFSFSDGKNYLVQLDIMLNETAYDKVNGIESLTGTSFFELSLDKEAEVFNDGLYGEGMGYYMIPRDNLHAEITNFSINTTLEIPTVETVDGDYTYDNGTLSPNGFLEGIEIDYVSIGEQYFYYVGLVVGIALMISGILEFGSIIGKSYYRKVIA